MIYRLSNTVDPWLLPAQTDLSDSSQNYSKSRPVAVSLKDVLGR